MLVNNRIMFAKKEFTMSFIKIFALLMFVQLSFLPFFSNAAEMHETPPPSSDAEMIELKGDSQAFKYVCPMHPQIVREHPGICPICGMDLVKQRFTASEETPQIKLSGASGSSALEQVFAIRTQRVQKTTLWKYIPTYGKVVADESKVIHIHPRASGWISYLSVRDNGEKIKKGQLLYRYYSPEIVSAQQDYLLALRNQARFQSASKSLVESAKVRLKLLGLDSKTIQKIAKSAQPINQIPFYATQSGYVGNLVVQKGMYIQPQTELMSLTDFSSIWVEAEVLPLQQNWIKPNLSVDVTSDAYPDKNWESQIEYIYPTADSITQALKVRVPIENSAELLKPNMLVAVAIYGGAKNDVLAIPAEAIIDDGESKRVVKMMSEGAFESIEIKTGMQTKGFVEVLSGLQENDKVVVSGQFLIDSESQIQTNLRRYMNQKSPDSHLNHAH